MDDRHTFTRDADDRDGMDEGTSDATKVVVVGLGLAIVGGVLWRLFSPPDEKSKPSPGAGADDAPGAASMTTSMPTKSIFPAAFDAWNKDPATWTYRQGATILRATVPDADTAATDAKVMEEVPTGEITRTRFEQTPGGGVVVTVRAASPA